MRSARGLAPLHAPSVCAVLRCFAFDAGWVRWLHCSKALPSGTAARGLAARRANDRPRVLCRLRGAAVAKLTRLTALALLRALGPMCHSAPRLGRSRRSAAIRCCTALRS
jgi:hypothetical protein